LLRSQTLNPQPSTLNPSPRGLTLIELLIVIIILTTLVSAAIPIMAPTNDDRRLREASRGVNSFISAAQMKAVQLQRPFGVALKRLSSDTGRSDPTNLDNDNAVSVELYYVEQPAPYRGFDRSSSAMVARHPNRTGLVLVQFVTRGTTSTNDDLPIGWDADLFPPNLIRPGDVIEIDGTRYELIWPTPATGWARVQLNNEGFFQDVGGSDPIQIEARPLNDTGQMLNVEFDNDGRPLRDPIVSGSAQRDAPFWTNPASYKILRQPMPTSAEPFQMPEGTAIDLRASGIGRDDFFYVPGVHDNSEGILIMFAPEGRVSRVTFSVLPTDAFEDPDVTRFDETVVDNLFLLVGRRENAPPPGVIGDKTLDMNEVNGKTDEQLQEMKEAVNWLRGESRWIVIGSQSGRVVTTENAFVNPQAIIMKYLTLPQSSEELRNEQIKASREYAREMTQVGGR
jgi:prepilin-type N-terminal cleavage/methylation domain-containing protein